MRRLVVFSLLSCLLLSIASAQPQSASAYDRIRADAEREYSEKSFRRAHELYAAAARLELTPSDRRWVEFRLAETTLRADAASPDADPTARNAARAAIEKLIAAGPDDELRAGMNEALGDISIAHRRERNASSAQQYYLAALEFWAGSSDLSKARRRYLDIVWKLAAENEGWNVPRHVLVNAVQIAEAPEERARARYLLARQLVNEGNPQNVDRALELLSEVMAIGRASEFYDDALYLYATTVENEHGDVAIVDYGKALRAYRRILSEFKPDETRFYDEAKQAIENITAASVSVLAGGTFLPESEQEVSLVWRNVARIELALFSVDLTRDARFGPRKQFSEQISIEGRSPTRKWTFETKDNGEHRPGQHVLELAPKLTPGAYILTAAAAGETSRQLILVTDAHILVHGGRERTDIYVSDVVTGQPIPNARVHVWQRTGQTFYERDVQTNASGLAVVPMGERNGETLITASAGARQAYHLTYSYHSSEVMGGRWRVYAFTDRPAYRPKETVRWKIIARVREQERWMTPAGQSLDYEITGPRGEKVFSGSAKLNAFGSFWGELPLTEQMALGAYVISFKGKDEQRGSAQLFRLEEYKLPEFLVKVITPEDRPYRLGETIEATIEATYYFGGPVANATVEAVVYQQPFHRYWHPYREYDWYYPIQPDHGGEQIKTETLQTDAAGRAVLRIDTAPDGSDMTYRIEARVVDASRREVRGEGRVRAMRQRYSVSARPEHYVHRPGDSVSIEFKAADANDKPVQTTGTVTVIRRVAEKRRDRMSPAATFKDETVLTQELRTDGEGEATLTFTPKIAGHYVIRWSSTDGPRVRDRVTTETAVWVADRNTTDFGYYSGSGVDLIVDRETMRSGDTASVMVVTPSSNRWVVFSTVAQDIVDTQVLHLEGSVTLVQMQLDERHVPNFHVTASSIFDRELASDTERVIVPPVEQFVTVDVKTDREQYEPRQEGTVTVTTRDASGKPVQAEVALSVSDEAVTAIQQDPAGDLRKYFYSDLRTFALQVTAGLHSQQYQWIEERSDEDRAEGDLAGVEGGIVGGVVGGTAGGVARDSAANAASPPPPPAPVRTMAAKAEALMAVAEAPLLAQSAGAPGIDVQVRTDFRSTALWKPDLVTDAQGRATVKMQFPEALTTWRATARAATASSQFGMSSSTARTNMPLLVRLQGPRFFVAGDRVVVSGVINNNTDQVQTVTPALEAEGLAVAGPAAAQPVSVAPHGESRVDWTVAAEKSGPARLRVTARTASLGDAMERTFVVYEHGIDKLLARSGKMRGSEALIRMELPRERRATDLVVQVAPSLAVTMLDALPYLIQFPYGCTEQTMSRFLPAAIVARTLEDLKLGRARISGKDLDAVTAAGIARLYDMQHADGAWGWWKEGNSDAFMTAYVVWGFAIARDGGLPVDRARIDRAAEWLNQNLVKFERAPNDQAWMLHALSAWRNTPTDAGRRAFDNVWKGRERLTAYSRALLALTAHRWKDTERAAVLIRNLEDGVQLDRAPDQSILLKGETAAETMATAHWGANGFWWRWYEGPVETTAFVLQALVTIDPKHKLIEPAMNWLVKNRRGTQWSNTRDTAISLLALNDYLRHSGELAADIAYELSVNGKVVATKTITAADVLGAPSRFTIDPLLLTATTQEVRIRRTSGASPLYFGVEARFVSLEEPVKAAGNELFVRREYARLAPRPTLLEGVQYDRVPLRDQESIASGERVEVTVTIDAKNDYSYLLFEDLKPAGLEAVELQSGQALFATNPKTGRTAWVYQELRDRKVAMFIDHLDQGIWEIRYTLRAEVPGSFHALPLLGQAMYVPDIRANGDEVRMVVKETSTERR